MPVFAHLPLILAPTGKGKLSKRHGGVEIRQFRRDGYLPEAMVNYLARLGWSYDDKTEIFDRQELVRHFGLDGINNSPARFSYERLEWMNAYYIRQLPVEELAARLAPFMAGAGFDSTPSDLLRIAPLMQERLKTLSEAPAKVGFFFEDQIEYDPQLLVGKKMTAAQSLAALQRARDTLAALTGFAAEEIETALRALSQDLELKVGQLLGIIRVAVTATTVAPPLFESLAVLGRTRTLARLDQALNYLRTLIDDLPEG
jgi:glutamyl-tRNA synthetase